MILSAKPPQALKRAVIACFLTLFLASRTQGEHTHNIMLTGYWNPTGSMLKQFSQNPTLNPDGWKGENWEGRGYDVYSFFPKYDSSSIPRYSGDFEVDYQDTSADFWRITGEIKPVGLISFGSGTRDYNWNIHNSGKNKTTWSSDGTDPVYPTPEPPDGSVAVNTFRYSSLPMQNIADALNASGILNTDGSTMDAGIIGDGREGSYLCAYINYHDNWYQDLHADSSGSNQCVSAGFIHVDNMDEANGALAAEITLRQTIAYIDSQIHDIDTDSDGLPDGWEEVYYGGATRANPNATSSNGVNTVKEAYIAGLDPTDPEAFFTLNLLTFNSQDELSWNAVSGRVYTLYWTSNLLNGFGSPWKTNITTGTYTDTTHTAEKKGFYKIEVKME